MTFVRVKTWGTNDEFTAADINAEFDNIGTGSHDRTAGRWGSNDDIPLTLGSSQDAQIEFNTDQTNDTLMIGVDGTSNHLVICQKADLGTDLAHANDSNPAIIIHAADAATATKWLKLLHDGTDMNLNVGVGGYKFQVAGVQKGYLDATTLSCGYSANQACVNIKSVTTELTGMSGATATASNLIPAASLVLGVTSRVTTLIEGCTSIDIGDGSTADLWANNSGITAGTTSTMDTATATTTNFYLATNDVVVTAVGGAASFSAGAIRLVVHYMSFTAPTS